MTTEVTLAADLVLSTQQQTYADTLNELARDIFNRNEEAGWWKDPTTGYNLKPGFACDQYTRNTGLVLALIHSEVSEALEGFRKNLNDDHLKHRKMAEVELADTIIRIMDLAGAYGFDIGGALVEKLEYNANRADHKLENRVKTNGKAF